MYILSDKLCPSGYNISKVTNTCYKWHAEKAKWLSARDQCIAEGGDLISLTTREKFDEFKTVAKAEGFYVS